MSRDLPAPQSRAREERTPDTLALGLFAKVGDDDRFNELLARRPDLSAHLTADERQMLVAAAERNNVRAVRLMLSAGWPVAARRAMEPTALHWAAFHGNVAMVRENLRYDPPIDITEARFKGTPLGWTLHGSLNGWHRGTGDYPACVATLLDAGAKLPDTFAASEDVRALLRQQT